MSPRFSRPKMWLGNLSTPKKINMILSCCRHSGNLYNHPAKGGTLLSSRRVFIKSFARGQHRTVIAVSMAMKNNTAVLNNAEKHVLLQQIPGDLRVH
jgi:hypothetical protein